MTFFSTTPDFLARRMAEEIRCAREVYPALEWVLTGGRTVHKFYDALLKYVDGADFAHDHFWFSDERCVPPDDLNSNVTQIERDFLSKLAISSSQIHRISGTCPPSESAQLYQTELLAHFPKHPYFNFTILSMGDDGHVASIFSNAPSSPSGTWVESVPAPTHILPHLPRVTLTFESLLASDAIYVLISGPEKRQRFETETGLPVHELSANPNTVFCFLD